MIRLTPKIILMTGRHQHSFRWLILFLLFISACSSSDNPEKKPAAYSAYTTPDWVRRSNVYEVNIRQYTREGTFTAFATHLTRLKKMGVEILWFMPIHPISKTDRKGTLGSYYAVADYYSVNPEFGSMQDFKSLVHSAHQLGFKVIIDWVPNHTGADHAWLEKHPEFYVRNAEGEPQYAYDWSDTRELDYANLQMRDSMRAAMKYWIRETGIDGYRVDIAAEVPLDFWTESIPQLRAIKPLFMLAEADSPELHRAGFDASYPWAFFHTMKRIAAGQATAVSLDSLLQQQDTAFRTVDGRMYFTSNHDENSWNESDYGTFPGLKHAPFAVLTHTLPRAIPLIYSGQEEPVLRKIEFFEKDPIQFGNYARASLYNRLLELRKRNKAMAISASWRRTSLGDDRYIFSYIRAEGSFQVLVITNLSDSVQQVTIKDAALIGSPKNIFTNIRERFELASTFNLEPWGYRVFEY